MSVATEKKCGEHSAAAWEKAEHEFSKLGAIGIQIAEHAYKVGWIDGHKAGANFMCELIDPAKKELLQILEGTSGADHR